MTRSLPDYDGHGASKALELAFRRAQRASRSLALLRAYQTLKDFKE